VGVAPAIANAIFHATGKRIRELRSRRTSSFECNAIRKQNHDHTQTHSRRYRGDRCAGRSRSCRRAGIECSLSSKEWNDADHAKRLAAVGQGTGGFLHWPSARRPAVPGALPARVSGGHVTFEPGARTAWHTHPLGQTLIVTSGLGWVQAEGGSIEEIRPGDVVWFPPGLKHWHGATPTTAMTHIAITEFQNGKNVDWLEKVSDEQYRR
jgi:quercetin dioxygenase-like cupin family protein